MRALLVSALALTVACGGSTDTSPVRYNFAVVDGANQKSTAGAAVLAKPITAQLTRDPQGKFATRVLDFFAPAIAYAQSINLAGVPVANTLVCGRESPDGEPKVVPLCAFTLSDGRAPNKVEGGTKAGTYSILFTAQVPSEEPVVDSTTVTVDPGPMVSNGFAGTTFSCFNTPATFPANVLKDEFGNSVPYALVPSDFAHAAGSVLGTPEARTLIADKNGTGTVDVVTSDGKVSSGKLTVGDACITLEF